LSPLERRSEFKRIILTIQVTLLAIFAAFVLAALDMGLGFYSSMLVDLSAVVAFSFSLYLITIGKFDLSKTLLLLYSCVCMVWNTSKDGRNAGNEYLWFPIICGIFLFFSFRHKKYIFFCLIITFGSMLFLEITDYSFLLRPQTSTQYKYINYIFILLLCITLIVMYMYYLIKVNSESEKKLDRMNKTLRIRNENLNKTNSELDSFVYKASHDLRAPLTSLLGLIEISKRETNRENLISFLELQEKSIKKLDGYIVDILNISRNARMEITLQKINFDNMLEQIFQQLEYLENAHSVKKLVSIRQDAPFIGDEVRINMVLINLISNSIRYADASKEEPFLEVAIKTSSNQAEITIADNGMGIADKHLTKVFNMFYRGTESSNGSGLGLYIVKETVQKLKGSITLESEYRKYTRFRIILPNHSATL
jgi:signal transduction histidine kinase